MKKLILLITILAITSTCFAYNQWILINEQRVDRGVMCTYEQNGNIKTIFKLSYCPHTL